MSGPGRPALEARRRRARTGPGPAAPQIGWPTWRLAWVIVFGAFASGLDASLVNVGIDTIGTDLRAGLTLVQWVATGYLLALAASLPLAGWLARRVGTGRLWLAALAVFTAASGGCALAPTIQYLIAVRVLQGLAGGLLIPAGQTILGEAVGAHRLGRVMATLGIAVTAAPALGPVLGGVLLHDLSWRWLFAINLPIGVAGTLLGLRYVPRGRPGERVPLDWRALALVSAGLPLLVYGLTTVVGRASLGRTAGTLAAGVAALAAFAAGSRRRPHPLVNLALLGQPMFTTATVACGLSGLIMFGSGLLFPLYFQLGRSDDPLTTGLHLLGLGGATALALPLVGRLVDRYGGGPTALAGTVLVAATSTPFAFLPAQADAVAVQILLALFGAAVAAAATPPGIAAYKAVGRGQLPDATTIVNVAQRVGGALGAALLTLVLARFGLHAAFWTLAGAGCLASLAAGYLVLVTRSATTVEKPSADTEPLRGEPVG